MDTKIIHGRITGGIKVDFPYDSCNTEVSQIDSEGKIYFKTFLELSTAASEGIYTKDRDYKEILWSK